MTAPRTFLALILALLFCLLANGITAGAAAVMMGEIDLGGQPIFKQENAHGR